MRAAIVTLVSLAATAIPAAAGELPFLKPTTSYSALRVIETPEGEFRQRVFWTPEKVRTETDMPGMSMTNIVRQDLGVMWIMPQGGGMCLEQTLLDNDAMSLAPGSDAYEEDDVEFKEIGQETIDGRPVTKYEVTSKGEAADDSALFWVTEENIPVRMEIRPAAASVAHDVLITLQDLEVGDQADELFETGMECRPMPAMPPGKPSPGS